MLNLIFKAIISFIAVSLDEFVVLIAFFSQSDTKFKKVHVVLGQIIGFTVVIGISLLGGCFKFFISIEYLSLVGFIPLFLGIYDLFKVIKFWSKKYLDQTSNEDEKEELMNISNYEYNSISIDSENITVSSEVSELSSAGDDENFLSSYYIKFCSHILNFNVLKVSATIISDASEEIGVFLPIFSTSKNDEIFVIILVYYVLILLQCFLANAIVDHKQYGSIISRYSKNIIPFILIAIGLFVLRESIAYKFLFS